jgi:O-antigen ligase
LKKEKLGIFFDKVCVVCLYILLFFIPISLAIIESFFGFILVFFLGKFFVTKNLLVEVLRREKLVLFFFGTLFFSLINSGVFLPISLHALFLKWAKYILLYVVTAQSLTSMPRVKCALASISLGAVLVILDCYSQLFLNFEFLRHRSMTLHTNNLFALTGPFHHNNGLAAYLICVLLVILYWVFSENKKIIKFSAVAIFFSGVFILSYSYSRGGWLIFIVAIVLLAFLLKEFRFLGFSLFLTIILGLRFSFFKSIIFKDSGRFELWDVSLRMIREHPLLGNGIGTFMALFRSFSPVRAISYAHNCFLQLWAEAGLVAVATFIIFVVKTLSSGLLFYNKTKDSIFAITVCAIAVYLCHSFFDTHLFSPQLAFLFWALMGLLKGYTEYYKSLEDLN